MPQLDLYIWGACAIEGFVFLFSFYFFLLVFFLPKIMKVLYTRKILVNELILKHRLLDFKLALIKEGFYWKPFIQRLNQYVSLMKLYIDISKLAVRWVNLVLVFKQDISIHSLFFFFFEYLVVLQQRLNFLEIVGKSIILSYSAKLELLVGDSCKGTAVNYQFKFHRFSKQLFFKAF